MSAHILSLSWLLATLLLSTASADAAGSPLLDPAASVEELRRLCREGGSSQSPTRANVDVASIIRRHERGLAACSRLIDGGALAGRDLVDVLLDRGDLFAPGSSEAYAQALADYGRAIALEPGRAEAFARRGKAHLLYARDLEEALRDLDEAIRLDAGEADFFVTRASILGFSGEPEKALADLDRALALDPASERARCNRGNALLAKGDVAGALADFDKAVALAPDEAAPYLFRSQARRGAGDEAGAKADEERAQELLLSKGP